MPTMTMSTVLPLITTPRWRQERVNQLIALLKLKLMSGSKTTKVLRALRGHDRITVEFTFIVMLEDLEAARIKARNAHAKAKKRSDLEDLIQTRVAVYAADTAYALAAKAYEDYICELDPK